MKIFLICPVRKAGDETTKRIAAYVATCESEGHIVHWPARDTKQNGDPIGIRICTDNREAMFSSDEVHVWYDPESRGSCFDIGMANIFRSTTLRPVEIANPEDFLRAPHTPQWFLLIHITTRSTFELTHIRAKLPHDCMDFINMHSSPGDDGTVTLHTSPNDVGALCVYGTIFASMRDDKRRIVLDVAIAPTPDKSFDNLLLWLADYTKDGPRTI